MGVGLGRRRARFGRKQNRAPGARGAVGGVATKPWRLPRVEGALHGRRLDEALCREAGTLVAEGAVSHGQNAFKIKLIQRAVTRALEETGGLA